MARGNENTSTEMVSRLILHTYPCNLPGVPLMRQPEGPSSLPSCPVRVRVKGSESYRHTVKVDDGYLLVLTR